MRIKEKLFREAAMLFEQKGYSATSVRDIAEAMHLKPSSLYSHIRHKEEILISICNKVASSYEQGLESILAQKLSPVQAIEAVIDLHVLMAYEDAISITVFNDEWRHLPGLELERFKIRRKEYEHKLLNIIREIDREGALNPLPYPFILRTMLSGMLWLHKLFHTGSKGDLKEAQSWMKQLILSGILR